MQIGRGRVEAGLYAQRTALAGAQQDALAQILFADQLGETLSQVSQLFVDGVGHWSQL